MTNWAKANRRAFPWREPDRTPYEILVAELLLKRTTAQAASRLYESFLVKFPNVYAIVEASLSDLETELSTIGLQKQRADGFKAMATFLVNRYNGIVPLNLIELLEIPHVGAYAARAVRSFGHNKPAAVVDSNVMRVFGRVFLQTLGSNPSLAQFQELVDKVLPKGKHKEFNWGVLDLGALVCRYGRPKCHICPLMPICDYHGGLLSIE